MGADNADSMATEVDDSGSATVVPLQVIRDDLGIGVADRSPECLDHLRDLGVPQGCIGKWRVHHDVIEAVAPGAVGFDRIEARPLLQFYGFLLGSGHKWDGTSGHKDDQSAHGELPQATLNVTLCTTLW